MKPLSCDSLSETLCSWYFVGQNLLSQSIDEVTMSFCYPHHVFMNTRKIKIVNRVARKKIQNQNESISQQWCSVNLLNNPVMSIALNKSNWKCIIKLWWKTKDKTKMFTNNKIFHQFFQIVILNDFLWRERQQQSIYTNIFCIIWQSIWFWVVQVITNQRPHSVNMQKYCIIFISI